MEDLLRSRGIQLLTSGARSLGPDVVPAEGCRYVALISPALTPHQPGLIALVDQMEACQAGVGIGALRLANDQLVCPPARIEDLRFREVPAASAAVLTRRQLLDALADLKRPSGDPFLHWRVVRTAAAASRVLKSNVLIATQRPEAPVPVSARVPIDLAGAKFNGRIRSDLVIVYGEIDASVSLYFDGLPKRIQRRLRYLRPSTALNDLPQLLAASLVVIVRSFEHLAESGTIDVLDQMGVPFAWFVDDNILKLAEDQDGFGYYSPERIESFIAKTRGVLVSTLALADAMAGHGRPVVHWPCVFDESLVAREARRGPGYKLRALGVVGGSFRRQHMLEGVLPAIDAVDPLQEVRVYGRFDLVRGIDNPRLRSIPMELSYRQFAFTWRGLDCDVLLHPRGEAANMPFKSPATILAARYIGALPVVTPEPAYAGLGPEQGVCIAGSDWESWAHHLRTLEDPEQRRSLFHRLDAWCREAFDPRAAQDRWEILDSWSAPATLAKRDRRLGKALAMPSFPDLRAQAEDPDQLESDDSCASTEDEAAVDTAPEPPPVPSSAQRAVWMLMGVIRPILAWIGLLEHARRWRQALRNGDRDAAGP